MRRFTVYSNPKMRSAKTGSFSVVLRGVTGWLKGLLALLIGDSSPRTPTSPGPRPNAGILGAGARLREDIDAVARERAA